MPFTEASGGGEVPLCKVGAGFGIALVDRVVLRVDLIVKVLVEGAALGRNDVGRLSIQLEYLLQLAQRGADLAVLPDVECRFIKFLLLLPHPQIFLFTPACFREQLQRSCFARPQLQNVLERFTSMKEVATVDVLARQPEPVIDLLFRAPGFCGGLQTERFRIAAVQLQDLLEFLES
ncbi:MAG: hypothetical protein FJW26_11580 [Acidimicrobiia bacterium]|nr:hypothetical protein [Acidimicrobiia bacterium]